MDLEYCAHENVQEILKELHCSPNHKVYSCSRFNLKTEARKINTFVEKEVMYLN